MQRKPIFSITIATYNRAHLLPRAVNSVLNQTYQNFELIIVDDGSTDNTKEVVRSFTDKRIIYQRHEKNKGYLAARNTGLDLAHGKYNCQLGDDDELLPNALETMLSKFNELSIEGVKLLWFDIINAESGKFAGSGLKKEGFITYEDLLTAEPMGDYLFAFDMDALGEYRFDERWPPGDGILQWRLHQKFRAYYVPEVLYKAYREHGGKRLSRDGTSDFIKHLTGNYLFEKTLLEEHGKELKRLSPRKYGQRLYQFGFYQILHNELYNGRKTLFTSFKYNFSFWYFILFLLSFILNGNQIKLLYIKFLNIN